MNHPAALAPGEIDADLARLSALVYGSLEPHDLALKLRGLGWHFSSRALFDHADTQAILVRRDDEAAAAIVFRGTEASALNLADLWSNAGYPTQWAGLGRAWSGYARALSRIRGPISWRLAELVETRIPLYLAGHSLGGALATLYAALAGFELGLGAAHGHLIAGLVTFGAPKAGNERALSTIACPVRRYVVPMDFAPHWPPVVLSHPAPEIRLSARDAWPGPISRHDVEGYAAAVKAKYKI